MTDRQTDGRNCCDSACNASIAARFLVRPVLSDRCLSCSEVGVLWPNGWKDQDETWHGGRSQPWPQPPIFRPMSIVAKRSPISVTVLSTCRQSAEAYITLYIRQLAYYYTTSSSLSVCPFVSKFVQKIPTRFA